MTSAAAAEPARILSGRTARVRTLAAPLRTFLTTEAGSAIVLLAAAVAALVWANAPGDTYERVWTMDVTVRIGSAGLSMDLREWINDGLMALFFFVIGLEIRRELDMGELRERRRVAVPVLAAIGGMVAPALIFVAATAASGDAKGWGIVIASDTAFVLGVLALVGRRCPERLRVFMLTLMIVDDVAALLVIALAYTDHLAVGWLLGAVALFGGVLALRWIDVGRGVLFTVLGLALWLATLKSGVHPTIAGVVLGLAISAYPPSREDLERAARLWRSFREQPTPELARSARLGVAAAISPNERLQYRFHPWTSYLVVPVFALANAGLALHLGLLRDAFTSPITLGIIAGLVVGKPLGIGGVSWLVTRPWFLGLRPTVGLPRIIGAAGVAGIGFTIGIFIADLAFTGRRLEEAKIGILAASILAAGLGWLMMHAVDRLPDEVVARAGAASLGPVEDLAAPVDADRDHIRGPLDAPVTLVEYGDFECPYCGRAEPVVRALLAEFGNDLRYVFRHLPLTDVHEHAELAAEAAEAAGAQGRFWEMHDRLFAHQDALETDDLRKHAKGIGLDVERFWEDVRSRAYMRRVSEDVRSADESGVAGTPTFFVNGRRHQGAYDLDALTAAVLAARARSAALAAAGR
jgi:Na+/H+ antiporter NhaA